MNSKNPLLSIIILNYNGGVYTERCLSAIKNLTYPNYEVILVDNASTDRSEKIANEVFSELKLIKNRKNLGYAGGNNVGIEAAKGEYILLLNNDTEVEPDFLEPLVEAFMQDARIGALQSKILWLDDRERLDGVGSFLTITGFLYHVGYGKRDSERYSKKTEIFAAKGACLCFRKTALEKTGLFDEDYFVYFEDTDLCWRVYLAGYKIFFVPDSIIYHKGAQTAEKLPNAFIHYHSYKNRIMTLIKNLSFFNLLRILPLHIFCCVGISLIYLLKGKIGLSMALFRALFYNIRHVKNTTSKRLRVQRSIRRVSDPELFKVIYKSVRPIYFYYLARGLSYFPEYE